MNKIKGQKIVSCRICKGDHWTTRCPYKDTLGPMQKELAEQLGLSTADKDKPAGSGTTSRPGHSIIERFVGGLQPIADALFRFPWVAEPEPVQPAQSKTGKYVPPSLRDGGTRRGESMQPNRRGAFQVFALGYVMFNNTDLHVCFCIQQLMTTLLFVWLICLRTLVRRTCKNSLDHLVPSQGSTWPRTRTLGSQRSVLVLPLAWGNYLLVFLKTSSCFSS